MYHIKPSISPLIKKAITLGNNYLSLLSSSPNQKSRQNIVIEDPGSSIKFMALSAEHIEACSTFLADIFTYSEPMSWHLELYKQPYLIKKFTAIICEHFSPFNLSTIALHNNKIIAACISTDIVEVLPPMPDEVALAFSPITSLLKQLRKSLPWHEIKPNQYILQFMVGTEPKYRNKNVITCLMLLNIIQGYCQNFRAVIAEATGPISQRLCHAMGYEAIASVPYEEFLFGDKNVFSGIQQSFLNTIRASKNIQKNRFTSCILFKKSIDFIEWDC